MSLRYTLFVFDIRGDPSAKRWHSVPRVPEQSNAKNRSGPSLLALCLFHWTDAVRCLEQLNGTLGPTILYLPLLTPQGTKGHFMASVYFSMAFPQLASIYNFHFSFVKNNISIWRPQSRIIKYSHFLIVILSTLSPFLCSEQYVMLCVTWKVSLLHLQLS